MKTAFISVEVPNSDSTTSTDIVNAFPVGNILPFTSTINYFVATYYTQISTKTSTIFNLSVQLMANSSTSLDFTPTYNSSSLTYTANGKSYSFSLNANWKLTWGYSALFSVFDASTKSPLSGATISYIATNSSNKAVTTSVSGSALAQELNVSTTTPASVTVSHLLYTSKTVTVSASHTLYSVSLQNMVNSLPQPIPWFVNYVTNLWSNGGTVGKGLVVLVLALTAFVIIAIIKLILGLV